MTDAKRRGTAKSPNFQFLKSVNPLLVDLGMRAERYALDDPSTALTKSRQLGELLAQTIASKHGIETVANGQEKTQVNLINELFRRGAVPSEYRGLFHAIRDEGNIATHKFKGDRGRAITVLRYARKIAVWFFKTFIDSEVKLGPFVPPIAKDSIDTESKTELERLRKLYEDAETNARHLEDKFANEKELRLAAESDRQKAFQDVEAALELADEQSQEYTKQISDLKARLAETSQATKPTVHESKQMVAAGQAVANKELSEDDTREIIDMELRRAGWIVDSGKIRHSKGFRPQKNKNYAIAEWPTETGPADYVLFVGLMPIGVVEAKRKNIDVAGEVDQAKRYSRGFKINDTMESPGGTWQNQFAIPFLFSSNGREYTKQLRTKSGTWFYDARRSQNLSRPLDGWYSPEGLKALLGQDFDEAENKLERESMDFLPLYPFQKAAIEKAEEEIVKGRRELLVAMATGTGKTRTSICLCYRLIKSGRFRRILFLVDRTSLGDQATDSFNELKLERQQSFSEIYDVKELGDIRPEGETKLHFATIQGMMSRVLMSDSPPNVDDYDCIIIDECHRGYVLDSEMSDNEMAYRDEHDYISKYTHTIDHFDAVKIGLTATPALHTLKLFGGPDKKPVYQYGYRQAVVDGYLCDYEPPFNATTKLKSEGIEFEAGEELSVLKTRTNEVELDISPDRVQYNVEEFNHKVIAKGFNDSICAALAEAINPNEPGKTLVFCVTDFHCDMVVDRLKAEFAERYDGITDDTVKKVTGNAEKPRELIRRYKLEKVPSVAVTVDLLTTGINVKEIVNIVFLRRVSSRILFDQMLGRATRLRPDLFGKGKHKESFRIYDCVNVFDALLPFTAMKPVVARPSFTFEKLVGELQTITDDEFLQEVTVQLLGKLQRKLVRANDTQNQIVTRHAGVSFDSLVTELSEMSPKELGAWFSYHPQLTEYLDSTPFGDGPSVPISEHEDEFRGWTRGYGVKEEPPGDYIVSFKEFIESNVDEIVALQIVMQRPRDLKRQQLRELKLILSEKGFSETGLKHALSQKSNQRITATIIGMIRNVMLNLPLIDYETRVNSAMQLILSSREWTDKQRRWLEAIGLQLRAETVVDRESLNSGEFRRQGGFNRINKDFDGELEAILEEIANTIWNTAG